MILLDIDLVQTSCGYGVPLQDYVGERPTMDKWAAAKGEDGIAAYWTGENLVSLDGLPNRAAGARQRRRNSRAPFQIAAAAV